MISGLLLLYFENLESFFLTNQTLNSVILIVIGTGIVFIIKQLINISNGKYIIEKKDQKIIFWNLKLGQGGFSKNASPEEMVGLLKAINIVAEKLNISVDTGKGYRALANISEDGGQEVPHLHFHLFGGEKIGKMVS